MDLSPLKGEDRNKWFLEVDESRKINSFIKRVKKLS